MRCSYSYALSNFNNVTNDLAVHAVTEIEIL